MHDNFRNKKVLITGAASGIGNAVARLFHNEGFAVAISDIEKESGEALQSELASDKIAFFYADVSIEDDVVQMVREATKWLGGLGILINNAGVGGVGPPQLLEDLTTDTWEKTINTNLRGTYLVSKYCLPHLCKHGGAIVNIISTYALVGGPELGAYCASKGGILALTRNIAIDYAPHGVRANALAPGFVDTPMLRNDINKDANPDKVIDEILSLIPQGELMSAEDVAKVIRFLASEDSKIMTGSVIVADGGYTAR